MYKDVLMGLTIYEVFDCPYPEYNGRRGYLFYEREAEGYCMLGSEQYEFYAPSFWSLFEKDWVYCVQERLRIPNDSRENIENEEFDLSDYGYGKIFSAANLDKFGEKTIKIISEYLKKPEKFFYLYGASGIGKTHICCYLTKMFSLNRLKIYSGNIRDYFEKLYLEQEISKNYYPLLNSWKKVDVLIIDDFGSQKVTDWRAEVILDLLDYRWSNNLPTFITSNLSISEVEKSYGQRIASRLGSGKILHIEGSDKRIKK